MQDLADAGASVLPAVTPDSGTPGRIALNAALAASAPGGASLALGPAPLLMGGLAAAPYLPLGRQATEWALTGRQGIFGRKSREALEGLALPAALLAPRAVIAQP